MGEDYDNEKNNEKATYFKAQHKKRINVKIIGFKISISIPAGPLTAPLAP